MRYGESVREISHYISQLTECNKVLYSYRHTPWYMFPLTNELPSTGLQHSCIRISESATRMLVTLVTKLVWSVAVRKLELQSGLAGDSTLGKYS